MFSKIGKVIFGSSNDRQLNQLRPTINKINDLEKEISKLDKNKLIEGNFSANKIERLIFFTKYAWYAIVIPTDAITTDARAKGKNSFNSKAFLTISASSGSSRFANLLSHGRPIKPIITDGTARNTKGKVIDHGDS